VKVHLESTSKIVYVRQKDGASVQARIWEGETESGIKVHAYITRIAAPLESDLSQFERELTEQRNPSADVEAIPLGLII
jgi:hypothetical protein